MKKLIIFSIISICFCCKKTETLNNLESDKTEFDWIVGKWIRKNDKDSKQTFENWIKKSNTEYLGLSYTLLKNDTVWKENVVLNKVNNKWLFVSKEKKIKNLQYSNYLN